MINFINYLFDFILSSRYELIISSGVTSALEETAATVKGFGRFLDSLKSAVDLISNIISLEVLILLIGVSFIGAGLSFLGIPKGRFSFFSSLFIADMFWFIWARSFNPDGMANKFFLILKTNLLLIIPFLLIYLFKTPAVSERFIPKVFSILKSPFKKKRSERSFDKDEIIRTREKLQESSMMLQRSLLNDILRQKDKDDVTLSSDTLKYKKELEGILGWFKED